MKQNRKRLILPILFFMCVLWLVSVPVSAAHKYKNQWVTSSSGNYYYYNEDGKKVTGIQKIGKKSYYFDKKGIQRTGWIEYKDSYYFFKLGNGTKGYRIENKTVNGIQLKSNGKAKLNSASRRKAKLMLQANKLILQITNKKMTRQQKLKAAFEYTKNHLKARNRGGFQKGGAWDVFYAEIPFQTGYADCYSYGAYFAYLANALGYKASVVSSGGHGWAEVEGKVYDANWAKYSKVDTYFGMSYNLSGVGGRPRYKQNRAYVKAI
ncbi:MAG: hypothetical protein PUF13_04330 [Lachnospiraceae bacterium]|nr:hypothetical protein [Lachnospiraceae bacterium]